MKTLSQITITASFTRPARVNGALDQQSNRHSASCGCMSAREGINLEVMKDVLYSTRPSLNKLQRANQGAKTKGQHCQHKKKANARCQSRQIHVNCTCLTQAELFASNQSVTERATIANNGLPCATSDSQEGTRPVITTPGTPITRLDFGFVQPVELVKHVEVLIHANRPSRCGNAHSVDLRNRRRVRAYRRVP